MAAWHDHRPLHMPSLAPPSEAARSEMSLGDQTTPVCSPLGAMGGWVGTPQLNQYSISRKRSGDQTVPWSKALPNSLHFWHVLTATKLTGEREWWETDLCQIHQSRPVSTRSWDQTVVIWSQEMEGLAQRCKSPLFLWQYSHYLLICFTIVSLDEGFFSDMFGWLPEMLQNLGSLGDFESTMGMPWAPNAMQRSLFCKLDVRGAPLGQLEQCSTHLTITIHRKIQEVRIVTNIQDCSRLTNWHKLTIFVKILALI